MVFRLPVAERVWDTISPTFCKCSCIFVLERFSNKSPSFQNSVVTNSTTALRIKTDLGATGSVVNATWSNITLSNIKSIGIDIQQDYENSGSTGTPSNGVRVAGITFKDISGWVTPKGKNYYILCGDGSCTDFTFENVKLQGGNATSSCNYPVSGCPTG